MASRLAEQGHDVTTVLEQRLNGAADVALAQVCAAEGRALVTMDLDFANPLRFDPALHAGVAVLRLPARPSPEDLLAAVETLGRALKAQELSGRLWIVERDRIREYDPGR